MGRELSGLIFMSDNAKEKRIPGLAHLGDESFTSHADMAGLLLDYVCWMYTNVHRPIVIIMKYISSLQFL